MVRCWSPLLGLPPSTSLIIRALCTSTLPFSCTARWTQKSPNHAKPFKSPTCPFWVKIFPFHSFSASHHHFYMVKKGGEMTISILCYCYLLKFSFLISDRSSYSGDVLLLGTFSDFYSVHWCNWCFKSRLNCINTIDVTRVIQFTQCQSSNVKCRLSNVKCQIFNVEFQVFNVECQISNVKCKMSNEKCRM